MDKTSKLVLQSKQGDKKAFEELYENYSAAIYGVILKMVNDRQLAEDLLQEVFVKAWDKIDTYNPEKGRFYTWIYRIARNMTINHFRKNRPENYSADLRVYDNRMSDEQVNVNVLDLKGKVSELDNKYKEIVQLIYFQGFTHKETHKRLGIPIGTVKTRLRKAIEKLRVVYNGNKALFVLFLILMTNG